MKGNIWIVAILIVVLAVGSIAIPATITDETTTERVTGEEQTLDRENASYLNNSDEMAVLYDNVTVRSQDFNISYQEGEDYRVDYSQAQIYANSTTLDDQTVRVNYSYDKYNDDRTQQIAGLFNLFDPIFGLVAVLSIFATLWAMMGWW